jgi:mannose-1-phosphate guanylyltransferase
MDPKGQAWTIVLAAGEGTRLTRLTTPADGHRSIPKQFCSLHGGPSLLQEAIYRASAVSHYAHTCAVVAEHQRHWWEAALSSLPPRNVIVQQANRGTGIGILLPLLHIVRRDPEARVLALPSDHHVGDEAILSQSLQNGMEQLRWRVDEVLLMGMQPDRCDPELGYILPGEKDGHGAFQVLQFIEKPTAMHARELIECGALWNSFIILAAARSLLALFLRRIPTIVQEMRSAIENDHERSLGGDAIAQLYGWLPNLDFSRDVLQGQEPCLRVIPVPPCGWSDLGTPQRVEEALRCSRIDPFARMPSTAYLNLAEQVNAIKKSRVA